MMTYTTKIVLFFYGKKTNKEITDRKNTPIDHFYESLTHTF